MLIPPPSKGRNIMRSECNQGVLPITFRRHESTVGRALEQHDLICPYPPIRERFAKILRHGPEIFSYDDAFVFQTPQRGNRQERLEGKADISAAVRSYAVGNEIETLQAQDMVQPNCPSVAHRRLQHAAKWLELSLFETNRIETGQAPVLPACVEDVRRRADRPSRQDRILIA